MSGADRLERRSEEWADRAAGDLADHPGRTALKWLLGFIGILLVIGLVAGIGNLIGAWGNEAKRVVSPENVTNQFDMVISDWQDMQIAADNACTATKSARQDGDPVMVEDPAQAYAASYRRIASDYNSRQQNIFKAGKVGPPGYPKIAPVVPASEPDWCSVSDNMRQIHP